ncbi:MAG: PoNi-like cognate immunity protein [Bernardetiaceae bacterium]|jgi:hypothetical protein|nr:PoNi-like cognate immunity protein [Bernardetiaceae bacterium]
MTKREPLMTEEYFQKLLRSDTAHIDEIKAELKSPPSVRYNVPMAYFQLLESQRTRFIAKYSSGSSIEGLVPDFLEIIETWETLGKVDTDNAYQNAFKKEFADYFKSLWLLSQGHLLGVGAAWLERLLRCIGNEGEDRLFEALARQTTGAERRSATKLLYPKQYQPLLDVALAPAGERPSLMRQFLSGWYPSMKKAGWHGLHKNGPDGGFYGYWCWEAAGVALAFGIDDESFRDLPYYPKDLAGFARGRA